MIIFRHYRDTLQESLDTAKIFDNINGMRKHIKNVFLLYGITISDDRIKIGKKILKDDHSGWPNVRNVYVDKQSVGVCSMDFNENVKTPIWVSSHSLSMDSGAYCPSCHYGRLDRRYLHYCPKCGQLIKWKADQSPV